MAYFLITINELKVHKYRQKVMIYNNWRYNTRGLSYTSIREKGRLFLIEINKAIQLFSEIVIRDH